jgi:hypothetical protein
MCRHVYGLFPYRTFISIAVVADRLLLWNRKINVGFACPSCSCVFFLGGGGEGPRSRCYGRTAAIRFIVQLCDEDEDEKYDQFFIFTSNGAPVELN